MEMKERTVKIDDAERLLDNTVDIVYCWECRYFKPYTDSRWAGGASSGHCSKLRQSRDESLVVHASKDFCSRGWRKSHEID